MSPAATATVVAMCASLAVAVTRHPVVVVVSFDGFRPDYVRPDVTPNLARFRDAAAAPPYMRPAFPTKTFVNHFTMATGLNPESHGVLDNNMFGPGDKPMHYTYEQFHQNDDVVPIWIQNENSGSGRHSGVMMWTGSEFPYQGKKPTYIEVFNRSTPWSSRVNTFMSWITDEEKPANLVLAYFEEPDSTGHLYGVGSQEIKNQIVRVDTTLKYITEQIKDRGLENKINLILLSDHGMDTVTYDKFICLDKYVSNRTSKILITGPNAFVKPNQGKFDEVYKNLKDAAREQVTFDVFQKHQLPNRWHMKNTYRLDGLLYLLAKPGHAFWDDYFQHILNTTTKEKFRVGTHGYDNEMPLMHSFFMAHGPAFKKNFTALPFDNVDLYPLISHMLDLKELPKNVRPNGTIAGVEQLLLSKSVADSIVAPFFHVLQSLMGVVSLHAVSRFLL